MQLFPAIDLRGVKVVRLTQGDYSRMTVYGPTPVPRRGSSVAAGANISTLSIWTARKTVPSPITTPLPHWQSRAACISRSAAASATRSGSKTISPSAWAAASWAAWR